MKNGYSAEIAVVGNEGIIGSFLMGGNSTHPRSSAKRGQGISDDCTIDQRRVRKVLARKASAASLYASDGLADGSDCHMQEASPARRATVPLVAGCWLLLSLDRRSGNELVMTQELVDM